MRTLLVDNYDSFTFNLYQLIARVAGEPPLVVANDKVDAAGFRELDCDNVVISPGPGRPGRRGDTGAAAAIIAAADVPVFGVCLGHQMVAHAFGAKVVRAPEPVHGRVSAIEHDGDPMFSGIARRFRAVRYHSLIVADPLPTALVRTAWTDDGLVMGLRHRALPLWGVQFHPEAACSEFGERLFENFFALTSRRRRGWRPEERRRSIIAEPHRTRAAGPIATAPVVDREASVRARPDPASSFRVRARTLSGWHDPEGVFVTLFSHEPDAFWLDSGDAPAGRSRFSFVGGARGPHAFRVSYEPDRDAVMVERGGQVEALDGGLFDYLERSLEAAHVTRDPSLPFGLQGGFVGYLGYEMKGECGGDRAHRPTTPRASFFFADRLVAFDHLTRTVYAVALVRGDEDVSGWFDEVVRLLGRVRLPKPLAPAAGGMPVLRWARSAGQYRRDVARCLRELAAGETYEACLTNRLVAETSLDPLAFYRALRVVNPAPHAAFLRAGPTSVACSSPERFLAIGHDGLVEAKPIKGTAPRGRTRDEDRRFASDLATSEKCRAENMMIVDLVRHDLGGVCEVGSIHVADLMGVESYETVHQLVTTVRGRLRAGVSATACVRAAFPPGSMTGAPKLRTCRLLDRIEGSARGVYSGALGYFSVTGAADLNVVIRTALFTGGRVEIGVGGAVVTLSRPADEFEETVLKARALVQAFAHATVPAGEVARETAAALDLLRGRPPRRVWARARSPSRLHRAAP